MPRKYPPDLRLRAVALAEVRSVPIAARELKIPVDTLTRWVEEAEQTPALQRAVDLALSELTGGIADGTIKGRDLTVAYGVLRDKLARYGKAETRPVANDPMEILERLRHRAFGYATLTGEAVAFWSAFDTWLTDTYPEEHWPIGGRLIVAPFSLEWHRLRELRTAPHDPELWAIVGSPGPKLVEDLLLWAIQRVEGHGHLGEYEAAREASERQQQEEMAQRGRRTALAYQQRALDAETQSLIAAAEAWLRETASLDGMIAELRDGAE